MCVDVVVVVVLLKREILMFRAEVIVGLDQMLRMRKKSYPPAGWTSQIYLLQASEAALVGHGMASMSHSQTRVGLRTLLHFVIAIGEPLSETTRDLPL